MKRIIFLFLIIIMMIVANIAHGQYLYTQQTISALTQLTAEPGWQLGLYYNYLDFLSPPGLTPILQYLNGRSAAYNIGGPLYWDPSYYYIADQGPPYYWPQAANEFGIPTGFLIFLNNNLPVW